jgi:hypothetical protein
MSIIGSIIGSFIRRSAAKHSLEEWQTQLAASGEAVFGRFQASSDGEKQQKFGRHIIGIERWSQSRLRVFLGEPFVAEEYDNYAPETGLTASALGQLFNETRQETIALAQKLQEAGITDAQTVPHNQIGELNARGWLAYISGHADRESRRL